MAKKRIDPKAKAKRQKIVAIGGLVLLVGILAIQVPRTMKMLNPAPPASSAETTTTSTTPEGATVTPTATPVATTLVDAAVVPTPNEGQLVTFSLFKSKNPFVPQVKLTNSGDGDGGGVPDGGDVPLPPDVAPFPPDVAPPSDDTGGDAGSGSDSGSGSGDSGSGAAPTTATITVNGVAETVAVGSDFPKDDPLFTLVALTATSAEIAIAGGSYQDGASTVTLTKGKTLTLMNTTDGARYEIRLVGLGAPEPSGSTP